MDLYIAAAVVVVLLVALVLCWMQPRRKQQTNSERAIAIMARDLAELPVRYMATGGTLPPTSHLVGERRSPFLLDGSGKPLKEPPPIDEHLFRMSR